MSTIECHDGANSYVYLAVVNDVLYVGDQGSGNADYDSIVVAPLSDAGKKIISDRKAAYAAALETTPADTTTAAPKDTTTPAPKDTTTPAPDDSTTAPKDTTTAAPKDTTTAGKSEKSGCGSAVALGLVACIIPAAAIIVKKKKD